jgi:hypothetical protein
MVISLASLISGDKNMPKPLYSFSPTPGSPTPLDIADAAAGVVLSGTPDMYCRKVYSTVPGSGMSPGDTVLDLGANMGVFSTMTAVGGAGVIAVEALSGFFARRESIPTPENDGASPAESRRAPVASRP